MQHKVETLAKLVRTSVCSNDSHWSTAAAVSQWPENRQWQLSLGFMNAVWMMSYMAEEHLHWQVVYELEPRK